MLVMTAAASVLHPVMTGVSALFMWICDILLISYYPLMPNDTEKQRGLLAVSSSRKLSLAGILPASRQLMIKAVSSERLVNMMIFTLGCIALSIRLIFIGVDFPVWAAVATAFFGALQMVGTSAVYAFESVTIHNVWNLFAGYAPLIVIINLLTDTLNEAVPVHTSISGGLAVTGFALLALLISAAAHKKCIADSADTAYNGEQLTVDS